MRAYIFVADLKNLEETEERLSLLGPYYELKDNVLKELAQLMERVVKLSS